MTLEPVIKVEGICKDFADHRALDAVDFKVPQGSIYGFLGPNGAGKTTTIKIILGLISSTAGKASVLGEIVEFGKNHNYLSRINYLPQEPVFPEKLSGKEVMDLVADIYKLDFRNSSKRIGELLEKLQLEDAANRKVEVYSRGMKQRLGIAAVLLTDPELLILDEPVSSLDPEGRRTVLELINSLQGERTVFFSSHILADVERVCDRVTIIDRGKKLLETSIRELLDRYAMEQYVIKIREEQKEQAMEMLRNHPAIIEVSPVEQKLLVRSEPGKVGVLSEELLPLLVNKGMVVQEFMPNRVGLEEVFFKVLEQNETGGGKQ